MKPTGFGMVGYGGIARVRGIAYKSIPLHYSLPKDTVKIVGVSATNAPAAEAAARELGYSFSYIAGRFAYPGGHGSSFVSVWTLCGLFS